MIRHSGCIKKPITKQTFVTATKLLAFIMTILFFSMSSCSRINTKETDTEFQSFSTAGNVSLSQPAQNQDEESTQTGSSSESFANDIDIQDIKQQYIDFIAQNSTRYLEFEGEKSTFKPMYTYIDLDNDSVDELIYSLEFASEKNFVYSFAYIYVFDIVNGNVTEIFGSDSVGKSRMTDSIRIYESDSKMFIAKEWRDGRYEQIGTLYSYDGQTISVIYSINGCYNETSFFSVSYLGDDAFTDDAKSFSPVTEDEFAKLQNELGNKGKTVFESDICFEAHY